MEKKAQQSQQHSFRGTLFVKQDRWRKIEARVCVIASCAAAAHLASGLYSIAVCIFNGS